jgi:phage terminase small subunit
MRVLLPSMKTEIVQALSPKMRIACAVYAATFSTSAADREAHLSAGTFASQLTAPIVHAEIRKNVERICRMANVDAAELLEQLSDMIHADIIDIYDQWGNFKPLNQWPASLRKMIVAMECYPSGTPYKVKFADKLKLIELAGKHVTVGAFSEQTKVTHEIGDKLAARLDAARQRATGITIDHN